MDARTPWRASAGMAFSIGTIAAIALASMVCEGASKMAARAWKLAWQVIQQREQLRACVRPACAPRDHTVHVSAACLRTAAPW
jgi:hypothetical protein